MTTKTVSYATVITFLDALPDGRLLTARELAESLHTSCQRLRDIAAINPAIQAYRVVVNGRSSVYGNKKTVATALKNKQKVAPLTRGDQLLEFLQNAPSDEIYSIEELALHFKVRKPCVQHWVEYAKSSFAPHRIQTTAGNYYGSCAAVQKIMEAAKNNTQL